MGTPSIAAQIKALQSLSIGQLRDRWRELYGEETRQRHRRYLIKRLAWKIQEQHFGEYDEETRARILEITPLQHRSKGRQSRATRKPQARPSSARDPRIPVPGTVLTRRYKSRDLVVKVLDEGFEYRGKVFRSLSAVAREITGSHWNGLLFFHLTRSNR